MLKDLSSYRIRGRSEGKPHPHLLPIKKILETLFLHDYLNIKRAHILPLVREEGGTNVALMLR